MDAASRFAALAHQGLPFYEFAGEFCKLAAATAWYDATLNKLFWLGANHHRPVDLPDTTGLSCREGVFRCLGSVRARARTSPPSFAAPASPLPFASPASLPLFAALPHPPPFVAHASPPPSAALPHRQWVWQACWSRLTQALCPLLDSALLCPLLNCAPKSLRFQSAPKRQISPIIFFGGAI